MPTYQLKPLDETGISAKDIGSVIELGVDEEPYFEGNGETSYQCGRCGQTVVQNIEQGQVSGIGLVCSDCGADLYLPTH